MQTEVTVKVLMTKQNLVKLLEKNGYEKTETFDLVDTYYSSLGDAEAVKNIDYQTLISKSFIVRNVVDAASTSQKIIYKNKQFDDANNIIGETKLCTNIEETSTLNLILKSAGLKSWCEVKDHAKIYVLNEIELILQEVDNLGLFLELEEYKSIENLSNEEKFETLKNVIKDLNIKTTEEYSIKKAYMLLHKDE